jgi:O-antigen ligase
VSRVDRVGLTLVALLGLWAEIAGLRSGRSAGGMILTIFLTAAAFAIGRAGARFAAVWLIPAAVVILGYSVFIHPPTEALGYLGGGEFLGYTNAKAAFFVQAAFGAAVIVATVRSPLVAVLSIPAIALFVLVPIHARSLGGFLSSLLLIPGLVIGMVGRAHRPTILLAVVLAFGAIGSSLFLAREFAVDPESGLGNRFADRLAGRAEVWADSYRLLRDHPGFGVGPGGFAENSPTAVDDQDMRWAHNGFLQQGAETGVLGVALLVGLVAWVFFALWRAGTAPAAVAALAVSSLVIHACADYLFHFPLLPAISAGLAGSATTIRRQPATQADASL